VVSRRKEGDFSTYVLFANLYSGIALGYGLDDRGFESG
jgi:hypothetical protein